jgi:hypothetical protein
LIAIEPKGRAARARPPATQGERTRREDETGSTAPSSRTRPRRRRRPSRRRLSSPMPPWSEMEFVVGDGARTGATGKAAVRRAAQAEATGGEAEHPGHRQESDLDGRGRGSARRVREPPTVRFSSRGMHGADARAPPSRRGRISIDRVCDRTSFVAACHRGVPSRVGARGDSSRLRTREEWQMGNRCLPGDLDKAFL